MQTGQLASTLSLRFGTQHTVVGARLVLMCASAVHIDANAKNCYRRRCKCERLCQCQYKTLDIKVNSAGLQSVAPNMAWHGNIPNVAIITPNVAITIYLTRLSTWRGIAKRSSPHRDATQQAASCNAA